MSFAASYCIIHDIEGEGTILCSVPDGDSPYAGALFLPALLEVGAYVHEYEYE